jgi:hypothetical protein
VHLPGDAQRPAGEHVVKYRQRGTVGLCALISEVVGGLLLQAARIPVVEPRVVVATHEFARTCNAGGEIPYHLEPGTHFGTPYLRGENGPVLKRSRLARPQQVVDLWVMDCWLCTTDRKNEGNTLLVLAGGNQFDLYAIDQSDCFGGPECFSDGTWRRVMQERGRVEDAGCLAEAVFACGGPPAILAALERADTARTQLASVIDQVPPEWWRDGAVDPGELADMLDRRYRRLRDIVAPQSWPNPGDCGGGIVLGGEP